MRYLIPTALFLLHCTPCPTDHYEVPSPAEEAQIIAQGDAIRAQEEREEPTLIAKAWHTPLFQECILERGYARTFDTDTRTMIAHVCIVAGCITHRAFCPTVDQE